MSKTYEQIVQQIEALKAQAEKLRRVEIDGVVGRIKKAIFTYGLTPADLGFGAAVAGTKLSFKKKPGPKRKGVKAASKPASKGVVRFRDVNGNTWVGRGPRPKWLRDAIASGKTAQDFLI